MMVTIRLAAYETTGGRFFLAHAVAVVVVVVVVIILERLSRLADAQEPL